MQGHRRPAISAEEGGFELLLSIGSKAKGGIWNDAWMDDQPLGLVGTRNLRERGDAPAWVRHLCSDRCLGFRTGSTSTQSEG